MNIRSYEPKDLEELKRIHKLFFAHESPLPDYFHYLCAFVVEDEKGIITFGGVRDIPECITTTNLNRDVKSRVKALYEILNASVFVGKRFNYDHLYAFSQNPKWARRLQKAGFRPPDGQSLILDL